ncbi:MoxR family ATPase [Halobacillus halophilus]|uniref:Methanol dehydrogenase regulatory protein n=1 Tax=Halobacillus halophilus (strain ATCC 35676 / DSM 2266 / JCM 20832 / KCTC 3685 / LMG 17431 / NBRC 102448 / NCIMB 2269) TaxID=866895 RepID=I0JII1_HALH3|nr:MoxR family ATPase [Halobacillus halophilus]ASF38133.1 MoxR family ATPase [Halobacillus halophilus]CCG43949.1 methanol dehydrogenase regulatory protein [Halobacillus halophilus DSM 2266]
MNQQTFLYQPKISDVMKNINKVMIGKEEAALLSIVALLAKGHVLLEDVPGVGKTMLVKTLAKSLDCEFKRIQFTPDLLPSDVTGVSIYNPKEMEFEFKPGPILGNIVLADEINRTSPKTQSALLEGMEETSITVDGNAVPLKDPFFVMATQNPIEYEGTYPLPEAQLDRFLLKMKMGYPTASQEMEMLSRTSGGHPINEISSVITRDELVALQKEVEEVYVDTTVNRYIIDLVTGTRNHEGVYLGVSPRGSISLMKAAKAYAFVHDRDYVVPDDVQYLAPYVLSHRMILTSEANFEGATPESIIEELLSATSIPVKRNISE